MAIVVASGLGEFGSGESAGMSRGKATSKTLLSLGRGVCRMKVERRARKDAV